MKINSASRRVTKGATEPPAGEPRVVTFDEFVNDIFGWEGRSQDSNKKSTRAKADAALVKIHPERRCSR